MCLRVTEEVAAELEAGTTFEDAELLHEPDKRFAGQWIAVRDGSPFPEGLHPGGV